MHQTHNARRTDEAAYRLVAQHDAINRELARNGVRFGVYEEGVYHDRLFPYDPIPRIIPASEFDELERGLKQRVRALNRFLVDVYHGKKIVRDGVIPEEFIYTSKGYMPQVNGITPPGGVYAHIAGEDLVQGEDGRWWVLEDNLRIPSGASYPLFVRDIERRVDPDLFRHTPIRDNRDYPRLLRRAMDFVSCEGMAAVLTPGRYNAAFFEHAFLAEKLGAQLVFPEDLVVEADKLYLVDYTGARHRIGVVYRRVADDYLDPFDCNPDSVVGVPGLMGAYRAGNVAIVNAPGNGVADDKGLYYFVPKMIRYYLDEEPLLHNAPTYLPLFEDDRRIVLERLNELVIKDVSEAGGYGVVFGSALSADKRDELARAIERDPRRFIAQEVIAFRDIPVIEGSTEQREPHKCDLRAFVVTVGEEEHVWYSGLTRYAARPGEMVVNSSQGGGFKDTWVLAPSPTGTGTGERQRALDRAIRHLLSRARYHQLGYVSASRAGNLYWLGRYTERVFTTISLFFPFYDQVLESDVDAFRPFARALDLADDFADFDAFLDRLLFQSADANSVASALNAAFNNAQILRPELTDRLVSYLELAAAALERAQAGSATKRIDLYRVRDVLDDLLAFWGGIENAPLDPPFKACIFLGKYLERLDLYTRFGLDATLLAPPLSKLDSYTAQLNGSMLPEDHAEGIAAIATELLARGYASAAQHLRTLLAASGGQAPDDVGEHGTISAMNMAEGGAEGAAPRQAPAGDGTEGNRGAR